MTDKDLEKWKRCVRKVKRVHGIDEKFMLIRGATLSQAQSCYCAVLQAKSVKKKNTRTKK